MTTPALLLAAAAADLGYTEHPPGSNRTKLAAEAGHANGYAWCATAVVAWARRAKIKLPSESAYTPTMAEGFRRAGRFHREPQVGDVAFFDFPDPKARIQHVGIVESFTATTVTCIEGNTSSGRAGSQDDGGGVFRRTRPRSHVVGYGRPPFTGVDTPPTRKGLFMHLTEEEEREILATVRRLDDNANLRAVSITQHVTAEATTTRREAKTLRDGVARLVREKTAAILEKL